MVTGLEELIIVGTVGPEIVQKKRVFFCNFQVIFMNTAQKHIQFFTGNIL